MCFNLINVANV